MESFEVFKLLYVTECSRLDTRPFAPCCSFFTLYLQEKNQQGLQEWYREKTLSKSHRTPASSAVALSARETGELGKTVGSSEQVDGRHGFDILSNWTGRGIL